MQNLFSQPNCSKNGSFLWISWSLNFSVFCLNLSLETYTSFLLRSSSGYSNSSHLAVKNAKNLHLKCKVRNPIYVALISHNIQQIILMSSMYYKTG